MADPSRLALRIVVPDPPRIGASVEVRPTVDGVDLLAVAFAAGQGIDPGDVPLLHADTEPREVRLAVAPCTEGCCGALYVTVRRTGDVVTWDGWRNPADDDVDLPAYRFDAGRYRAEIERVAADRGWEWPARTVARLLERDLATRTAWLDRWECELDAVAAWPWERDAITLFLFHPSRAALRDGRPWLQFRSSFAVSGDDPQEQAERLAQQIVAADPRRSARVCGGSAEFARQLGYPWPEH